MKIGGILVKLYRNFIFRRLVKMASIIYIVITITFFHNEANAREPIDVFIQQMMTQYGMSYDEAKQLALSLFSINLDAPLHEQYFEYIANLIRGNLGVSILSTGTPVAEMIAEFMPWTIFSVSLSLLTSFAIGVTLGMFIAYRRGGILDRILTGIAATLSAIPNYLIGILIIVFVGIQWNLYPMKFMRGAYSADVKPGFTLEFIVDVFKHLLMLFITYVLATFGGWVLSMKASTISTLGEDYVTVARAKGL